MPNPIPQNLDSTLLDNLTPTQAEVLKLLAAGSTVSAAARHGGVHRSTIHLWTRHHPAFSRALLAARQDRAEALLDELSDLSELALDTFRQLLSDPNTPAATRLKAAMEIVKLVQNQRPTELARLKSDLATDRVFEQILAPSNPGTDQTIEEKGGGKNEEKQPVRNAPCPCGSRLKYKRCCGGPATPIQQRAA